VSEGEIRDVQTEQTDEYWSINIKKGLVSLFQVKINGRSTISDGPVSPFRSSNRWSEMMNPLDSRSRFGFTAATDKLFKVMEVCRQFVIIRVTLGNFMSTLRRFRFLCVLQFVLPLPRTGFVDKLRSRLQYIHQTAKTARFQHSFLIYALNNYQT